MSPLDIRSFEEWQERVHAFVALCGQADTPPTGPLAGLTVGVKDIIDVAGLPTRNGSDACRDAPPAREDAAVVGALRRAGARIIGKTTTTEFAFTGPTECRNPHDLSRSPGGSSSGSGAAVAAGMVDLALGTQTAGSLCRPAAYCGVVGFKPSYDALSTVGVTPLARSFDTIGIIAASVEIAARSFLAIVPAVNPDSGGRVTGISALPQAEAEPCPAMADAFREAALALGAIAEALSQRALPMDAEAVVSDHRTVMVAEAAATHRNLLAEHRLALLRPKFRAGLLAGASTSAEDVAAAWRRLLEAKERFWSALSDVDVILTLAVPEGAPLIDGTTGFQNWLTPWTVFGGPLVSLPWGVDEMGRPRSVMLAAHPGDDARLLRVAAQIEAVAPPVPRPMLKS